MSTSEAMFPASCSSVQLRPNPLFPQVNIQQEQPVTEYNFVNPAYGELPVKSKCPSCKQVGVTVTKRQIGVSTWMVGLTLTLFCLVPCNYYPFCMPQCKDVVHHCPNCDFLLGKKALFG